MIAKKKSLKLLFHFIKPPSAKPKEAQSVVKTDIIRPLKPTVPKYVAFISPCHEAQNENICKCSSQRL
jgi:hypothetical protein